MLEQDNAAASVAVVSSAQQQFFQSALSTQALLDRDNAAAKLAEQAPTVVDNPASDGNQIKD